MDTVNRVKIEVNGVKYVISTRKEEPYVKELGRLLDTQVKELMDSGRNLTLNDALVVAALNYIDAYRDSVENADHLRSQVKAYLEDAMRARIEADEAKREIDRLNREIEILKRGKSAFDD